MEDTIAAISTPRGEGAISIVRLSGPKAFEIVKKIFKPKDKNIEKYEDKKLIYGDILEDEKILDEVLVAFMYKPNTYTKEDLVEINCHGGSVPVRQVLNLVLKNGARMAEPGEFTKTAFLNGRLDLSQAESVMDLISSKTPKGFEVAYNQLDGYLSKKINKLRKILKGLMAKIEVGIDYPEADIKEITHKEIIEKLKVVEKNIDDLLKNSDTGKIIREGLSTVIVGKPNVGKSSLLNALLKEAKAIVTNIPGTTRDVIEEYINVNGIPLKIIDTAGIREAENEIEKIGVEKSKKFFNKADLVILVLNNNQKLSDEDRKIIEKTTNKKVIVVINKIDLEDKLNLDKVKNLLSDKKIVKTSIINEKGVKLLEDEIAKMVYHGDVKSNNNDFITNIRHINSLKKALTSTKEAINATESKLGYDFIEIDIKQTYEFLGEITGESLDEDIINSIFDDFCLGK